MGLMPGELRQARSQLGFRGISDGWAARKEKRQRPEVRRPSLAVNFTEIKAYLCRITVPN